MNAPDIVKTLPKHIQVGSNFRWPLQGLFVCLGGRQGEANELNCNPLQRVCKYPIFQGMPTLMQPHLFMKFPDLEICISSCGEMLK